MLTIVQPAFSATSSVASSLLVLGKGNLEHSTLHLVALELADSIRRILRVLHLDEASASRVTLAVVQETSSLGLNANAAEQVEKLFFVSSESQVANEDNGTLRGLGLANHGSVGARESSRSSGTCVGARSILVAALAREAAAALSVTTFIAIVATFVATALPGGLARPVATAATTALVSTTAASLAPAATAAFLVATSAATTTGVAASAAALTTVTAGLAAIAATAASSVVVIATTTSASALSPVVSAAILLELGQLSALLDVEVDAIGRLNEATEVFEEALVQVSADVENDTGATGKSLHVLDLLSGARVPVLLENGKGIAMPEATARTRRSHDHGLHALSTVQQTLDHKLLLVVAGRVGKDNLKGLLSVTIVLSDESLGQVLEEVEDLLVDVRNTLEDATLRRLDDVSGLRDTDTLKLDTGLILDALHELVVLSRVERDAHTTLTSSGGTTGAMDVRLSVLWWLDLNDEVDVGDVETASSNVRSDEHLELVFLEALDGDLTLTLHNITVHDLHLLLDLLGRNECVSVTLGGREDDSLGVATVANESVSED